MIEMYHNSNNLSIRFKTPSTTMWNHSKSRMQSVSSVDSRGMKGLSIDSIVDVLKMEPGEVLRILEQAESLTEDLPDSKDWDLHFEDSISILFQTVGNHQCGQTSTYSYLLKSQSDLFDLFFLWSALLLQMGWADTSPKGIALEQSNPERYKKYPAYCNYQLCLNDHTVGQRLRLWTRKFDLGLNSQNLDWQVVMQHSVMWCVVASCLGCGLQ